MHRYVWAGVLGILAGMSLSAGRAAAQGPPGSRVGTPPAPWSSPYLNLVRGRSSPAVNYYGIVRPQQQAQSAIQSLEAQQMTGLNPVIGGRADGSDLPGTGVPIQFMNHYGFFMNLGAGGAGSFGSGMPGRSGIGPAAMNRPAVRGR